MWVMTRRLALLWGLRTNTGLKSVTFLRAQARHPHVSPGVFGEGAFGGGLIRLRRSASADGGMRPVG
jgi:hypothetical protein